MIARVIARVTARVTARRRASALAAAVLLALTGCGGDAGGSTTSGLDGTVDVLAAASLADVFGTLADRFQDRNPGVEVRLDPGASSALARRIVEGAPADVFASASTKDMQTLVDAGLVDEPTVLARNGLQVAVPADNPARVERLEDLAREDVRVALCQPQVPCGAVAARVLDAAGVDVTPVTEEADVRATLTKVRLGEVDAAVVYVTDVLAAAPDVRGIDVPRGVDATTDYPVATVTGSEDALAARAFVDLVLSEEGARVLGEAGFRRP